MSTSFTPPPLSSHQGPAPEGFTPPPLSSHQGPADSQDRGFWGTLWDDVSSAPKNLADFISNHPVQSTIDTLRDLTQARHELQTRADAASKSGDPNAPYLQIFAKVPIFGPMAAAAADEIDNGKPGQGHAHALEMVAPLLGDSLGDLAQSEAAGTAVNAAKAAAPGLVKAAAKMGAGAGLDLIPIPGRGYGAYRFMRSGVGDIGKAVSAAADAIRARGAAAASDTARLEELAQQTFGKAFGDISEPAQGVLRDYLANEKTGAPAPLVTKSKTIEPSGSDAPAVPEVQEPSTRTMPADAVRQFVEQNRQPPNVSAVAPQAAAPLETSASPMVIAEPGASPNIPPQVGLVRDPVTGQMVRARGPLHPPLAPPGTAPTIAPTLAPSAPPAPPPAVATPAAAAPPTAEQMAAPFASDEAANAAARAKSDLIGAGRHMANRQAGAAKIADYMASRGYSGPEYLGLLEDNPDLITDLGRNAGVSVSDPKAMLGLLKKAMAGKTSVADMMNQGKQ